MDGRSGPALSYLICATPRSGSTLLCAALDATGIAGHPEEHFEVLLETGQRRQPRDYFQRSNDPEVWALLDDPEFRDILGEYGGRYSEHPAQRDPSWIPGTSVRPTVGNRIRRSQILTPPARSYTLLYTYKIDKDGSLGL